MIIIKKEEIEDFLKKTQMKFICMEIRRLKLKFH